MQFHSDLYKLFIYLTLLNIYKAKPGSHLKCCLIIGAELQKERYLGEQIVHALKAKIML